MIAERLHAFLEGSHIEVFLQDSSGISFEYDDRSSVGTPISLSLLPTYETSLAMPIGGARYPTEVTDRRWLDFAQEAGLDVDRVRFTAHEVTTNVRNEYEEFFARHFSLDTSRMKQISKHTRSLDRALTTSLKGPI